MGQYTTFLEDKSFEIFDKEDYIEELKKVTELFRTFDKALDTFIVEHGFIGDIKCVDEKIEFISVKLKEADIEITRNMKNWYLEHKRIKRKTAFQLCFAFKLKVDEVNDFLRRICLDRGFDCHLIEEIVYFYAFKNGMKYKEAEEILAKVEKVKPEKQIDDDSVYTSVLIEEIDDIKSVNELVKYLNENICKFDYNNVTSSNLIKSVWKEISKIDGVALREKKLMYKSFNKSSLDDIEKSKKDGTMNGGKKEKRELRKRVDDSIWEIYLQILGLSGDYVACFYKDRSIKSILVNNDYLHPLAEDSFPDRDGLNKILIGNHVSHERVRKTLILLVFYRFWASKALLKGTYEASYGDFDRCMAILNDHLTEAGYPLMYAGNPYDFIFIMANNSQWPLLDFRQFMREMFFDKVSIEDVLEWDE